MADLRKPLESLADFVERFSEHKPSAGRINLFRGHADASFRIWPSLFRKSNNRKDEKNIFRELVSMHPTEFLEDKTVFEQLVRMQHYSLPTRLLDITYNPLVGLYFACSSHREKDGQLLRFSVKKTSVRYYDSDTASCLANLSNLTGNERDEIRKLNNSAELRDNSRAGKRLLQFIRAEKPYFLPEIDLDDLKSVIPVRAKNNNRRLIAQQGAFLLFGLPSELKTDDEFGISVFRIPVPKDVKTKIIRDLDRINFNEWSLFPEIESAARYIMNRLTPVDDGDVI